MLEKFTYTNHIGETIEFGKDCLFVNENDLRDFAWETTTKNNKISSFRKGVVSKTIPIILKCKNEADGVKLRNRLFEVCEKDVLAMEYGKIYIGDYYLQCYVTENRKSQYLVHKSYMLIELRVQTDLPMWVRETTTSHKMGEVSTELYLDALFDYPHDFKNDITNTQMNNENFVASNFIITIYGYAQNPELSIGGHKYGVDVIVGIDEYLTIDSIKKTIVLTRVGGEKVNCFNNRQRDSYIFEKIPPGFTKITSPKGELAFDITLLEERSEPKWT